MRKLVLIALIALVSCSKDEVVSGDNGNDGGTTVTLNNEVNDFVWKGLNSWYNWQAQVTDLADTKDDNTDQYYTYLNGFSKPEDLFNSLKHPSDDFSWFIEDYVAQQQAFQGITKSFGFRIALVRVDSTDDVVAYIQFVSTGSPADLAGFKRGDIFNGINGNKMTTANFRTVLEPYSAAETATFNFVETDGVTSKEDKTITGTTVADNPVHLTKVFDNINGKKVGYLVYNGFRSSFNDELNAAFAQLKSAGIQELVLDLRINGGGSVLTSAYLASMITAEVTEGTTFGELRYNSKHTDRNARAPFFNTLTKFDADGNNLGTETINRVSGLTRLYVLASGSTASASEMIINGLRPFIDVKVVGVKTTGKNEGSITLYDSPTSDFTDVNSANPNHKNAMQPIVFQIYNSLGQSDYADGFEPNIKVEEFRSWRNILPFGDENEVLLKAALDDIKGITARSSLINVDNSAELIQTRQPKFSQDMYIDHNFIELVK
ncbi:S41 family peptidase [Tenacibaculum agarivorans]|uniref:S41 family peptidase n=1 Tax=Tenacibaculum agarivorans TaxID=1908389 RepID=UPI00094BB79B|nr:S41 family peptidase [Tenacibaculum agarivorans]